MNISLEKVSENNLENILIMQKESFNELLMKYNDYETNPANEKIEDIMRRFFQSFTEYLLIKYQTETVGVVRVVKNEEEHRMRISPIFILPSYQGKGISQETFFLVEKKYDWVRVFELDTILEEEKLCYLYEKLGYKKTGEYKKIKEGMTIVFYEKKMY